MGKESPKVRGGVKAPINATSNATRASDAELRRRLQAVSDEEIMKIANASIKRSLSGEDIFEKRKRIYRKTKADFFNLKPQTMHDMFIKD